jgi:cyclic beta-1,2-glucan synthetase
VRSAAQLAGLKAREASPRPRLANKEDPSFDAVRNVPPLEFFNGLGGFAASGREYVTVLKEREWTPAPWCNVIANPEFGFLVSADGVGSTYSINAQQNQLTPWSNDPVSNAPAEIVYIRDQDSGDLWSATPLPIREAGSSFVVSHGFGYTRFQHASRGIALELLQFVPLADPIKVARLKIANRGDTVRNLSITHYLEWVLGNQRARTAPFVITEIDGDLRAARPQSLERGLSRARRLHGHAREAADRLRRPR